MIHIDTKFSGKVIICGLNDDNVKPFTRKLLKHIWLDHDIPGGMKFVGSGQKLTLEMLPANFKLNDVADNAVDKGLLMLERIGGVNVWVKLFVTKVQGTNPQTKIYIDKYEYEKEGANLSLVVNKAINDV